MTDQEFDAIRKLLQERSAIVLETGKQYLVETRLAPLLRQLQVELDRRVDRPVARPAEQRTAPTNRRGHGDHRKLVLSRPPSLRGPAQGGFPGPDRAAARRTPPAHLVCGQFHRPGTLQRRHADPGTFSGVGRVESLLAGQRHFPGCAGAGAGRALQPDRSEPRPAGGAAGEILRTARHRLATQTGHPQHGRFPGNQPGPALADPCRAWTWS